MKGYKGIIIVMVAGFGICMLLFSFLVKPNLNKITALYDEAAKTKTEYQALLDQILAYKSSQSELASVTNLDFLLESVIERNQLQTVTKELELGATNAGVAETLTIKEELDAKGKPRPTKNVITGLSTVEDVYYHVGIQGSFLNVVKFIQYLEHLPHFTEILSFDIRATSGQGTPEGFVINSDSVTADMDGIFMVKKSR